MKTRKTDWLNTPTVSAKRPLFLKLTVTVLASSLLLGCSSEDNGSHLFPDLERLIGSGASNTDGNLNVSELGNEDIVEVPGDDPLGSTELSDLYGRAIFGFGFTGSQTTFIYDALFGPDDVVVSDSGILFLDDMVDTFKRDDPNSEFVPLSPERLFCAYLDVESGGLFLCNVFFDQGGYTNFLFGRIAQADVSGLFTYCQEGLTTEQCIDELIDSPDGEVLVRVIDQSIASGDDLRVIDEAKETANDVSVEPYLSYYNQGVQPKARSSQANSTSISAIARVLEENRSRALSNTSTVR